MKRRGSEARCHCGHAVSAHNNKWGCTERAKPFRALDDDDRVPCLCYCTPTEAAQERGNCP